MAIYTRIQAADLEKIVAPYQIEVLGFTPIEGATLTRTIIFERKRGSVC